MLHLLGENRHTLEHNAGLLHLNAVKLAEGMRSGTFRSLYYGQGIEFAGVRDYLCGDDVRSIDWNVTARLGKPFVKNFEEERELTVFLIVDQSVSMTAGCGKKSKLETAMECAALVTLASEVNSNPVGAVIFDGQINFSVAPKAGKNQTLLLLKHFDEYSGQVKNGSALDNALQGAEKLLKKRSLIFVISDFRTSLWEQPLGKLCTRHDVVAVNITDPFDEELPSCGSIPFVDLETGISFVLPTGVKKFKNDWHKDNETRNMQWKKNCLRHGAFPFILSTETNAAVELTRFFSARTEL